jgi:hypothetical protein
MRKALSKVHKWSSTLINFVLFAFEQLAYLEIMGAEYMAFCPDTIDDEYEEIYEEMKGKDE